MTAREPRFTADLWAPHGELFAKLGIAIRDNGDVAKLVADNKVEFGNACGAIIKSLTDAGYTFGADGKVIPPAPSAGPVKELPAWGTFPGDANNSNRKTWVDAGMAHSVKFTVPVRPVRDATPQVAATISILPQGSGSVYGKIVANVADFKAPSDFGAGGTTYDSVDFDANQGKTLYFVFILGTNQPSTDVNVLIQLPTK